MLSNQILYVHMVSRCLVKIMHLHPSNIGSIDSFKGERVYITRVASFYLETLVECLALQHYVDDEVSRMMQPHAQNLRKYRNMGQGMDYAGFVGPIILAVMYTEHILRVVYVDKEVLLYL